MTTATSASTALIWRCISCKRLLMQTEARTGVCGTCTKAARR